MSGWSLGQWRDALEIILIVGNAIAVIAVFYLRSTFATKAGMRERFKSSDDRVEKTERRISKIEGGMKSLATQEDVNGVKLLIEHGNGERKVLSAKLEGVDQTVNRLERSVSRIEEYLLHNKGHA